MANEMMDMEQLAAYLRRDVREVGKLANRGHLPGHKVGGQWRFARAEINYWIETQLHGYNEHQLSALEKHGDGPLLLTELLSEVSLAVPLPASTKASVLRELVALAERSWQVYDATAVLEAIRTREELGSDKFILVASEARPGGNVTGILVNLEGLPGKQFQLAAELVPGANKIGFLFNLSNPGMTFQRPEIEAAASALAVKVVTAGVRTSDDLDAAFRLLAGERVASVMVGQDGLFVSETPRIAALAAAARLPWVSGNREFAEAGAVISYGVSPPESYRRAATYVDKILKGAKAGDLPVELPTKVEMVINLKSAKALGLTIAPMLLTHADEVIE